MGKRRATRVRNVQVQHLTDKRHHDRRPAYIMITDESGLGWHEK
jgi:hypothetical protein